MCVIRLRSLTLLLLLATLTAGPARAETVQCLVSRGNLCFPTGCDDSAKTQRIILDLGGQSLRICPNRYDDAGCSDTPMQFDIRETAIVGVAPAGTEIAARAVFMNRVTGAFSTSLLAAGLAGIDFGSCDIRR